MLPRIEDGLRPAERRLLEAMRDLGAVPPRPHRKTTRVLERALGSRPRPLDRELVASGRAWRFSRDPVVGAYAALAEMASPLRARVPLVDPLGNFGSPHGEPPADHVYTECRLTPWGVAALAGLAPNLLVNGARESERSLAFLPHHPAEVIDALVHRMQGATVGEAIALAGGLQPDFAGGGLVERASLEAVVQRGAGTIVARARTHIERADGLPLLVVTEGAPETDLDEPTRLATRAVREGTVTLLRDILDESTAAGVRVVFVGARGAAPEAMERELSAVLRVSIRVSGVAEGREGPVALAASVDETAARLAGRAPELRAIREAYASPRRTTIVS